MALTSAPLVRANVALSLAFVSNSGLSTIRNRTLSRIQFEPKQQ